MARDRYDALFAPPSAETHPGDDDAHPFLGALARLGRARRDARALAQAELEAGTWATAEDDTADSPADPAVDPADDTGGAGPAGDEILRLAAQDHAAQRALYTAGPWRVALRRAPDGQTRFTQLGGPAGATIALSGPPAWVPLVPDQPQAGPVLLRLPPTLRLLDAHGVAVVLHRAPGAGR